MSSAIAPEPVFPTTSEARAAQRALRPFTARRSRTLPVAALLGLAALTSLARFALATRVRRTRRLASLRALFR